LRRDDNKNAVVAVPSVVQKQTLTKQEFYPKLTFAKQADSACFFCWTLEFEKKTSKKRRTN